MSSIFALNARPCLRVLAVALLVVPVSARAEVIWGNQTGLGELRTEKVNLTGPGTITAVTYRGTDYACIWSGVPRASVVACGDAGSFQGMTLPAGQGYFAIPKKPTPNSNVEARFTVQ